MFYHFFLFYIFVFANCGIPVMVCCDPSLVLMCINFHFANSSLFIQNSSFLNKYSIQTSGSCI